MNKSKIQYKRRIPHKCTMCNCSLFIVKNGENNFVLHQGKYICRGCFNV